MVEEGNEILIKWEMDEETINSMYLVCGYAMNAEDMSIRHSAAIVLDQFETALAYAKASRTKEVK